MSVKFRCFRRLSFAGVMLVASAPLWAQAPPAAPATAVLTNLTIKPGVDRARLMKVMPDEVRDTVRLYLDGKIQQWYGRGDGTGVIFVMNCATVAEAQALMDTLPLSKAGLANYEFTVLSPLTPLRMLLGGEEPKKTTPQP